MTYSRAVRPFTPVAFVFAPILSFACSVHSVEAVGTVRHLSVALVLARHCLTGLVNYLFEAAPARGLAHGWHRGSGSGIPSELDSDAPVGPGLPAHKCLGIKGCGRSTSHHAGLPRYKVV